MAMREVGRPIARSATQGEDWSWFVDELAFVAEPGSEAQ
jgi:hypothetical protein